MCLNLRESTSTENGRLSTVRGRDVVFGQGQEKVPPPRGKGVLAPGDTQTGFAYPPEVHKTSLWRRRGTNGHDLEKRDVTSKKNPLGLGDLGVHRHRPVLEFAERLPVQVSPRTSKKIGLRSGHRSRITWTCSFSRPSSG